MSLVPEAPLIVIEPLWTSWIRFWAPLHWYLYIFFVEFLTSFSYFIEICCAAIFLFVKFILFHLYIVGYYIKRGTTSWTYSTMSSLYLYNISSRTIGGRAHCEEHDELLSLENKLNWVISSTKENPCYVFLLCVL